MKAENLLRTDNSFDAVVSEYSDMVTRLCCLNLKDADQVVDCWQVVFLTFTPIRRFWKKPMPKCENGL